MVGGAYLKRQKAKRRTLRIALIAVFVALITVGAFIKIPIGIVPVSMQCACCILCALLLGPWDSLIAVGIYIFMGLIGIPIFTAGGGFGYVLQPTFGYIAGYLAALPIGGMIARGVRGDSPIRLTRLLFGAFAALAIVYTCGVMYMYLMLNFYVGTDMAIGKAWLTGCAVFLPTDAAWCVIGSLVARRVAPAIDRDRIAGRGNVRRFMYEEYARVAEQEE